MRILALIPGGIGDQILFFPTLETLKSKYPKSIIDVIVEPRSKGAYRICPWAHEVLLFDYKDRNGPADYLNLLGIIRDREYDIALALGTNPAVGFLLWLDGISTRVGYQRSDKSWFINNPAPLNSDQYAASMYHDLLKGLQIDTPTPALKVVVPKDDINWAKLEGERLNLGDRGYVIIHGGSSQLAQKKGIDKIYPIEKWQVVIDDLRQKQPDLPIVLIKGPEDDNLVKQLLVNRFYLKVTSPPDLGKLAAMIAGANLMLCTDSGPMHISIAVGTPTIALFGPTQVSKLIPSNQNRYIGIQSPTGKIGDIQPETLLKEIWRV
jgi:ADP-heptose:LPS heptosyltransferase